jgi:uncharacterized protein (UPF0261 family)
MRRDYSEPAGTREESLPPPKRPIFQIDSFLASDLRYLEPARREARVVVEETMGETNAMNDTTQASTEEQPAVYILATLDTKGREAAYLGELLSGYGVRSQLVDAGCLAPPTVHADVSREVVFSAGGYDVHALAVSGDRGQAVSAAAAGAAAWICRAQAAGRVLGVIGIGGSAGTTIGTAAMRVLPIGVPKLMTSTLASGQVRHYVGGKDIFMLNSVVDLSGLNRITRAVLGEAARAMAGLVRFDAPPPAADERPLIAATMFGVTTPCVERAKAVLEQAGYEVLVFHATGVGGQAMESLVDEGLIAGVLDITTTELADELVGGVLSAGPERLTTATRRGVPQVVSVGATDMVNFHAPSSVPEKFRGRTFYQHNPNVTLMRTTAEECARIGADMGRKLSAARGAVAVLLPGRGVSAIDRAGQPFDDPAARRALASALREAAPKLEINELDLHINDSQFAIAAAERLLALVRAGAKRS